MENIRSKQDNKKYEYDSVSEIFVMLSNGFTTFEIFCLILLKNRNKLKVAYIDN